MRSADLRLIRHLVIPKIPVFAPLAKGYFYVPLMLCFKKGQIQNHARRSSSAFVAQARVSRNLNKFIQFGTKLRFGNGHLSHPRHG